ncbi:hypothetical protein ANO14919_089920 [Xylariales sp. No.14919]|nr:hypothetical protein ANO14919_089920 [Xylariales sp. No.14919]
MMNRSNPLDNDNFPYNPSTSARAQTDNSAEATSLWMYSTQARGVPNSIRQRQGCRPTGPQPDQHPH